MDEKIKGRLARLKPNTGHAKILRARLGITEDAAPAVEPVVEKKPRKKRTKKTSEQ
jgi:hypothetical protein